jgi:sugar phosphate permease
MRFSAANLCVDTAKRAVRTYDVVLLIALLWFMVQFLRFVFPPLFGTFQELYGVSNTQTGLLFTLLMLGYSAMQFPGGLLADRIHEVTVIIMGAGLFTAAAVFTYVAPTFGLIMVAAMVIGFGTGIHKTVAIAYFSRVYPERTGFSLGIMDTVGQFGGMLAPIAVVAILGYGLPGRIVFLASAGISAALVVTLYLRAKPSETNGLQHKSTAEQTKGGRSDAGSETGIYKLTSENNSYIYIFTDQRIVLFLCVTVLFSLSWNGLSAFFPLFLTDTKGFSPGTAGVAYSLLFAASISQTVTGIASDKIGKLAISVILFSVMIAGLLALLFFNSVVVIIGVTVLTGIGFHGFRPVRDSYLMDLIPTSIGGGTLGIVRTFMTAIGGVAPLIVGLFSDLYGYTVAFGLIVCALIVGCLFIVALRIQSD